MSKIITETQENLLELGGNVVTKIAFDTVYYKQISVFVEQIFETVLTNGIYIFAFKKMLHQFLNLTDNDAKSILAMAIVDLIAKSSINVGVKLLLQRKIEYYEILMNTASAEALTALYRITVKMIEESPKGWSLF